MNTLDKDFLIFLAIMLLGIVAGWSVGVLFYILVASNSFGLAVIFITMFAGQITGGLIALKLQSRRAQREIASRLYYAKHERDSRRLVVVAT